jgi:hypothetical protein
MEDWDMWLRIAERFPLAAVKAPWAFITDRPGSNGKDILAMRDSAEFVLEKAFSSYASNRSHMRRACLARVHYHAGASLRAFGLVHDARQELVASLRLDPFNAAVYWRLAMTLLGPKLNRMAREVKAAMPYGVTRWRHGKDK